MTFSGSFLFSVTRLLKKLLTEEQVFNECLYTKEKCLDPSLRGVHNHTEGLEDYNPALPGYSLK